MDKLPKKNRHKERIIWLFLCKRCRQRYRACTREWFCCKKTVFVVLNAFITDQFVLN